MWTPTVCWIAIPRFCNKSHRLDKNISETYIYKYLFYISLNILTPALVKFNYSYRYNMRLLCNIKSLLSNPEWMKKIINLSTLWFWQNLNTIATPIWIDWPFHWWWNFCSTCAYHAFNNSSDIRRQQMIK